MHLAWITFFFFIFIGSIDALVVDWASLVDESRPRAKAEVGSGSARHRWEGLRVLSRIGVSLRYAGQEMVNDIIAKQKALKQSTKGTKIKEEDNVKKEGEDMLVAFLLFLFIKVAILILTRIIPADARKTKRYYKKCWKIGLSLGQDSNSDLT